METMYAALLIHKAGKEVNEENMKKVLDAAGIDTEAGNIKAVVAALKDSNIDEIIEKASAVSAAPAPTATQAAPAPTEDGKKEEEDEDDDEKKEEEAAAGLAGLFG